MGDGKERCGTEFIKGWGIKKGFTDHPLSVMQISSYFSFALRTFPSDHTLTHFITCCKVKKKRERGRTINFKEYEYLH